MSYCELHKNCITDALKKGEQICAKKGLKFTEIRRKVLALVWESHKPMKAYDILEKLKKGDGAQVPPTVYRALDFLQANGLVHRINSLNAFVGCSHPGLHNQCYFLICNQCNDVTECCTATLGDAINTSTQDNSFTTESVSLEIQGVCQSCSH